MIEARAGLRLREVVRSNRQYVASLLAFVAKGLFALLITYWLASGLSVSDYATGATIFSVGMVLSDGQGCWRDNIFVERLWRTIKYEEVYLHAYATVSEARAGLGRYLTLYNTRRPHSSLADQTPDVAYLSHPSLPLPVAA